MTDVSTALLMIGPSGVGPFHSPHWRLAGFAQLVEGGSNGPYWLYRDTSGRERVLMIDSLDSQIIADSLLLLIAVMANNSKALGMLEATHNVSLQDQGQVSIAPYWELADTVRDNLASAIRTSVRAGLVILDDTSVANHAVIAHLLGLGITLNTFISGASVP